MSVKKIIEIFAELQEGYIEEMSLENDTLNMKVECTHIANQIDNRYSNFYVVLKGAKDVYFRPWDDEEMTISDIKDINLFKLDILNVEFADNGYFKIYSNCEHVYSGGCLYVLASDILIFDEGLNLLNLDELHELSDKYWFSSDKLEN